MQGRYAEVCVPMSHAYKRMKLMTKGSDKDNGRNSYKENDNGSVKFKVEVEVKSMSKKSISKTVTIPMGITKTITA
jgi:hypothetical protein